MNAMGFENPNPEGANENPAERREGEGVAESIDRELVEKRIDGMFTDAEALQENVVGGMAAEVEADVSAAGPDGAAALSAFEGQGDALKQEADGVFSKLAEKLSAIKGKLGAFALAGVVGAAPAAELPQTSDLAPETLVAAKSAEISDPGLSMDRTLRRVEDVPQDPEAGLPSADVAAATPPEESLTLKTDAVLSEEPEVGGIPEGDVPGVGETPVSESESVEPVENGSEPAVESEVSPEARETIDRCQENRAARYQRVLRNMLESYFSMSEGKIDMRSLANLGNEVDVVGMIPFLGGARSIKEGIEGVDKDECKLGAYERWRSVASGVFDVLVDAATYGKGGSAGRNLLKGARVLRTVDTVSDKLVLAKQIRDTLALVNDGSPDMTQKMDRLSAILAQEGPTDKLFGALDTALAGIYATIAGGESARDSGPVAPTGAGAPGMTDPEGHIKNYE